MRPRAIQGFASQASRRRTIRCCGGKAPVFRKYSCSTGRTVDRLHVVRDEHVRQRPARRRSLHTGREARVHRRGRPRRVDVAHPPLDGQRIQAKIAKEVPVPDRPAGRVAVHADALSGQILWPTDGPVTPDVQVAGGEVPKREHGQADIAAVALLHPVEVLRHRPLAALDLGVLDGAPQHLGARGPRSPVPEDHGERDAFRADLAGGERQDARVVGAGESDSDVGHVRLLDRPRRGRPAPAWCERRSRVMRPGGIKHHPRVVVKPGRLSGYRSVPRRMSAATLK